MLLNSTISTTNARFITCDISNFYLNTTLPEPEYMKIPIRLIPSEIISLYKLNPIISNKHIYLKTIKGMYGLKQAGTLANKDLQKHLRKFGYSQMRHTPGLWSHETRPISFTLVVDDFGIKFINTGDALHLLNSLSENMTLQ